MMVSLVAAVAAAEAFVVPAGLASTSKVAVAGVSSPVEPVVAVASAVPVVVAVVVAVEAVAGMTPVLLGLERGQVGSRIAISLLVHFQAGSSCVAPHSNS